MPLTMGEGESRGNEEGIGKKRHMRHVGPMSTLKDELGHVQLDDISLPLRVPHQFFSWLEERD
jgi:hypothetical protein